MGRPPQNSNFLCCGSNNNIHTVWYGTSTFVWELMCPSSNLRKKKRRNMPPRWYIQRLQSHPWTTNISSAAILMLLGDLGAQWLEHRRMQLDEDIAEQSPPTTLTRRNTIKYRFYGDLSPPVETLQHELHEQRTQHQRQGKRKLLDWMSEERLELHSYDPFRTATMVLWATLIYTPYFMTLFRLYARYLPTSPNFFWSQAAFRAVLTYTAAAPLTVAFFAYGCTVHHLSEQFTNSSSSHSLDKDTTVVQTSLWTAIRLKLESQLENTLITSAVIWLPVNFVNFALIPPHWRPGLLMSVSVFWNGYLSLAQHRDVDL